MFFTREIFIVRLVVWIVGLVTIRKWHGLVEQQVLESKLSGRLRCSICICLPEECWLPLQEGAIKIHSDLCSVIGFLSAVSGILHLELPPQQEWGIPSGALSWLYYLTSYSCAVHFWMLEVLICIPGPEIPGWVTYWWLLKVSGYAGILRALSPFFWSVCQLVASHMISVVDTLLPYGSGNEHIKYFREHWFIHIMWNTWSLMHSAFHGDHS